MTWKIKLDLILIGIVAPLITRAEAPPAATVLARFELPPTALGSLGNQPFTKADLAHAKTNGLKRDDLPSLGSGLAWLGGEEFIGISDRGPNGQVDGIRTYPLRNFAPHLTRFRLSFGQLEIISSTVIRDARGKALTGWSNQSPEERLFAATDDLVPLPYDPNGVDPESVRVFPDGKFLMAEEYGPSVLVVDTNGQVLVRYVPSSKPLSGATYPVKAILPPVLSFRRTNRGFEALALSRDGRTAYALLQSPLGPEESPEFRAARVARTIRLDVSNPLDARVTGHFLMPLSPASDYAVKLKQAAVKVNDAEWLAPDRLLILEQGGDVARLVVADFSAAGNLSEVTKSDALAPEASGSDLTKLPVVPATVTVWATISGLGDEGTKVEGLAVLSPTEIAIANDNDFGLGGTAVPQPSTVWRMSLPRPLPLAR